MKTISYELTEDEFKIIQLDDEAHTVSKIALPLGNFLDMLDKLVEKSSRVLLKEEANGVIKL